MFENLLYQDVSSLLISDINSNKLPSAILLSGPSAAGKLTCALELARVLSCVNTDLSNRGHWLCECSACKKNKALSNVNVLLAGPRDCLLEIFAAKKTFLQAVANNSSFVNATRYLFIRAVKKLTIRFSQVLWEDHKDVSKIAAIIQIIDENLELLDPEKPIPFFEDAEKIAEDIVVQCEKLDSSFMYDSISIDQIRKASYWARIKSPEGKKIFIVENAEQMNENSRNALLKILEEPPEDSVFILTTSKRGAVMPTILSRVRTYTFVDRTLEQQKEVIERVFHDYSAENCININTYLQNFLPVSLNIIKEQAKLYFDSIINGQLIPIDSVVKACSAFKPRILFKVFLTSLLEVQKAMDYSAPYIEFESANLKSIRECYNFVSVYNQTPLSALEKLYRDIASNRRVYLR
ncbi:MAG: DNA polymerase III [Treponema sp.]|nr:DNA polymerase III [Treponema sp.]